MLRSEEGRSAIEARIAAHWVVPPTRPEGNGVVADLGVCPGKIEQRSNGVWTIAECEFNDRGELAPRELVRVLTELRAKFPAAKFYQLDAVLDVQLRTPARFSYRYLPARDELQMSDGFETYSSPRPIGGDLSRLRSGDAPVRKQDLRLWDKNRRGGSANLR